MRVDCPWEVVLNFARLVLGAFLLAGNQFLPLCGPTGRELFHQGPFASRYWV